MIDSDEKPIFIIGSGRSGTTLARYILNAHPNIYIAEEIAYYFWMKLFRGDLRERLYRYFNTFSYVWLRQNPKKVMARLPADLDEGYFALAYREILKDKAQQYQRGRFGEKHPLITVSLDQVFSDFPSAKVINVVRDPRANVFSHTTMPWASRSLLVANNTLKTNYKLMKKHDRKILSIKLEDLIANPQTTIARMLSFVEEPWSDRVLAHEKYTLHEDGIPFPWLGEASKDRKVKSLKWTDGMSPAWIRLTEWFNRKQFEEFEYSAYPLTKEPTWMDFFFAVLFDIPHFLYFWYRALRMVVLLMITAPEKTWKVQAFMHSTNPKAWDDHPEWNRNLLQIADGDRYRF